MSGRVFGRGRGGGHQRVGGPAYCVYPKCGYRTPHIRGAPCLSTSCPKCGTAMVPPS